VGVDVATIALIDYGAGNLTSVRKALAALEALVSTPRGPEEVRGAAGIIVPGVGHFDATAALDAGWRQAIHEAVQAGRPLLGICLGLQWLFEGSDEAPDVAGLGLLAGRCALLPGRNGSSAAGGHGRDARLKVPHVGWNRLDVRRECEILAGVPGGAYVYFTHSYAAPITPDCAATTEYGETFASVVARDRVFGVQFHPEKSAETGLMVLRNFLALVRAA
jgi:glutamine amidotransferase